MNIAIVDDLANERHLTYQLISEYANLNALQVTITEYVSGEAFLADFLPGRFDVVFMDIYMDNMNGFDTAQALFAQDDTCKIIFLTTSEAFGVKSYSVRATDYILKPVNPQAIARALSLCLPKEESSAQPITFNRNRKPISVNLLDILYIDRIGYSVTIHLWDRAFDVSGSFASVTEEILTDKHFVTCYKGIVVNVAHIKSIENNNLILQNGEIIPVSRRCKNVVEAEFLSFSTQSLRNRRR